MFKPDDVNNIRRRVCSELGNYIEVEFDEGLAYHGIFTVIWFRVDGQPLAVMNWSGENTIHEMVTYKVGRAGLSIRSQEDLDADEYFASLDRATDRVITILKESTHP